jgi:hypothetical protein
MRLYDSGFNADRLIPDVRSGIGIGTTLTQLVNGFGQPRSKDVHYDCPLKDITTTTYSYSGIDFWVCTNKLVYLIDIK